MRYFAMKRLVRSDRGARQVRSRRGLAFEALELRDTPAAGPLGMNAVLEFVDAIKTAQDWAPAPSESSFSRDAEGWPERDSDIVIIDDRVNQFWNGPDPHAVTPNINGTYHLSF